MKPFWKLLTAGCVASLFYLTLDAQTPAASTAAKTAPEPPLGLKCIVTVDPQASRTAPPPGQSDASGFDSDGTVRGELVELSREWCVLKDGTQEKWIPRDKVLLIFSSR